MPYSSLFRCKRIHTGVLRDPDNLRSLIADGFQWIRRLERPEFHEIVRNPTLGCIVEIFTSYHTSCIRIESPAGKKLINKLCYI